QSADDSTAINTTTFKDWHSQSNAKVINPEHLSLAITVDFEKRQIRGHATWEISPEQGVEYAIFDTRNLTIDSVLYASGKTATFTTGETDTTIGTALKIKHKPTTKKLTIYYKTGENATALQWLKPSQTFGGEAPYFYTQGETIYT